MSDEITNALMGAAKAGSDGLDDSSAGTSNSSDGSGDSVRGVSTVNDGHGGDEIETAARAQGWRPREEYEGPAENWVNPELFLERGKFFKQMHQQNRKLDAQAKALNDMKVLLDQAQEHALKVAREELRAAKVTALKNDDHDKVLELDDQLADLAEKKRAFEAKAKETSEPSVESNPYVAKFQDWVSGNQWYTADAEMRADADVYGTSYLKMNPTATPDEVFGHVDAKIRRVYPEKFGVAQRSRAGAVAGASVAANGGKSRKDASSSLTSEEREVAANFARLGVMTVEQYAKQKASMK